MPKSKKRSTLKGLSSKYGATVRKRYTRVVRVLKTKRRCPSCGRLSLKREAAGKWRCSVCAFTAAGGAYDISIRGE